MKTVIAEKPSVAREIAKILGATQTKDGYIEGNGYYVTWAFGHLVSLCMPEQYGVKGFDRNALPIIPDPFILTPQQKKSATGEWVQDPGALKQLKIINSLFQQSDSIIVATDAGREGELIFRYIYSYLQCTKPFQRLWISSLTDKAIKQGFQSLDIGAKYDNLYFAAKARSEADWLIGLNSSQAISIVAQSKGYSLGRVQTPTLALICRRYIDNKNFTPVPFWVIKAHIAGQGDQKPYHFASEPIKDIETAKVLATALSKQKNLLVEQIESKEVTQHPPLLFDLTALQKTANSKLNLSAQATLDIAQSLYEKKLITYPRTGSCYISDDVFEEIPRLISKFIERKLDHYNTRSVNTAKVTDHHAILPTGEVAPMSDVEIQVYKLIIIRLLEAFSAPCLKKTTKVTADLRESNNCGVKFITRGEIILSIGWRAINGIENDDNQTEPSFVLPQMQEGDLLPVVKLELDQRATSPKALYTEATLLGAMENAAKEVEDKTESAALKELGLGTPATRASIIEILFSREYIERQKKSLVPTEKGLKVFNVVKDMRISDVGLTGNWEAELDRIAKGQLDVANFNHTIKQYCHLITTELLSLKQNEVATDKMFYTCPICKQKSIRIYDKIAKCQSDGCELKIFREVCGKKLTDNQVEELINKGKTKNLKGFKSKAGKEFSAMLIIDDAGTVKMEFNK